MAPQTVDKAPLLRGFAMNGKWWIFATEEARQKIQFPSIEDELSKFYLTIGSEGVKSINSR